ncbi:hypothetical protein MKZ38_010781 [Zalerion maritima]|uniref:Uncharacterized protein n=1 Tax=Zalerion maritima TaxID=339359 RepID=A0AAD5S054_9PEZI|nr:hypothetical protein MKZ38_010781 [Zalerion maritima]
MNNEHSIKQVQCLPQHDVLNRENVPQVSSVSSHSLLTLLRLQLLPHLLSLPSTTTSGSPISPSQPNNSPPANSRENSSIRPPKSDATTTLRHVDVLAGNITSALHPESEACHNTPSALRFRIFILDLTPHTNRPYSSNLRTQVMKNSLFILAAGSTSVAYASAVAAAESDTSSSLPIPTGTGAGVNEPYTTHRTTVIMRTVTTVVGATLTIPSVVTVTVRPSGNGSGEIPESPVHSSIYSSIPGNSTTVFVPVVTKTETTTVSAITSSSGETSTTPGVGPGTSTLAGNDPGPGFETTPVLGTSVETETAAYTSTPISATLGNGATVTKTITEPHPTMSTPTAPFPIPTTLCSGSGSGNSTLGYPGGSSGASSMLPNPTGGANTPPNPSSIADHDNDNDQNNSGSDSESNDGDGKDKENDDDDDGNEESTGISGPVTSSFFQSTVILLAVTAAVMGLF